MFSFGTLVLTKTSKASIIEEMFSKIGFASVLLAIGLSIKIEASKALPHKVTKLGFEPGISLTGFINSPFIHICMYTYYHILVNKSIVNTNQFLLFKTTQIV